MKVSELKEKLGMTLVTKEDFDDREIKGCYIGDLLSWVMGRAQSDNVWITIMNNINIVAVAYFGKLSVSNHFNFNLDLKGNNNLGYKAA